MLAVVEISDDEYMVMDTRNLEGQPNVMFLDARQVAPALVAHSLEHDDALSRERAAASWPSSTKAATCLSPPPYPPCSPASNSAPGLRRSRLPRSCRTCS